MVQRCNSVHEMWQGVLSDSSNPFCRVQQKPTLTVLSRFPAPMLTLLLLLLQCVARDCNTQEAGGASDRHNISRKASFHLQMLTVRMLSFTAAASSNLPVARLLVDFPVSTWTPRKNPFIVNVHGNRPCVLASLLPLTLKKLVWQIRFYRAACVDRCRVPNNTLIFRHTPNLRSTALACCIRRDWHVLLVDLPTGDCPRLPRGHGICSSVHHYTIH